MNQEIVPLFNDHISLSVPGGHDFANDIETYFYRNESFTGRCFFDYNGMMYCHVYNYLDLLASLKNKELVLQCFELRKLENTKINDNEDI
jgi:hypothetical protein